VNRIFKPYLRRYALFFSDNIFIYSKTWLDHISHLDKVLQNLEENQVYAKKSKCTFGQQEVEYFGHVISKEMVKVDPQKIQAITMW